MKRFALVATLAATLLAGGSTATAATFQTLNLPAADGSISGTFGNTDIGAAGAFSNVFDFTLPTGLTNFTISSTASSDATNVNFTSVSFNGMDFAVNSTGTFEIRSLEGSPVMLGGVQHLVVNGVTGSSGAYAGTISFAPGAVPEPATWGLMIVGFGGVGGLLRSRRRQGAAFA